MLGEVVLTLAAVVLGAGLYMCLPDGHKGWGIALTVVGIFLFIYAGVRAIELHLPFTGQPPLAAETAQNASPSIQQKSEGPYSPNVANFGNNSSITINPNPNGTIRTYDFNGARHDNNPAMGKFVATIGEETDAFARMKKLYADRKWQALIDLSETQIRKTPEWLTPYEYAGVAYMNLGNISEARERLSYVDTHAAGRPEYADAKRLLGLLAAAPSSTP